MAKHTGKSNRKRMSGSYLRGNVNEQLALGTLAAKTLISAPFDEVAVEKTFVSSMVGVWALADATEAAGDGPILVGVAHSDYTDPEIEAVIEATGSWDPGDKIQNEIGKRLVRKIGTFAIEATGVIVSQTLNDGKPIKTKLNWSLTTGKTLRVWAYNMGTSSFGATDPTVTVEGHCNLWL